MNRLKWTRRGVFSCARCGSVVLATVSGHPILTHDKSPDALIKTIDGHKHYRWRMSILIDSRYADINSDRATIYGKFNNHSEAEAQAAAESALDAFLKEIEGARNEG